MQVRWRLSGGGIVTVNTQSHALIQKIRRELTEVMPLLFILFFTLAGANLHIMPRHSLPDTLY